MSRLQMIASMLIFGTIGIFVKYIPLPSSVIALSRSVTGTVFMGLVMAFRKTRPNFDAIRRNALLLIISGAALGFNWILLFEAYNYTTVAVATLCYYMAPVFVVVLSPIVLKEKLTAKRLICTGLAVVGAVLISGATTGGGDMRGVFLGLGAAVLYCSIILLNRFLKGLTSMETTLCQLLIAAVVMLPYVLLTENVGALTASPRTVILLLTVGVVHTGFAYLLFFTSVVHMSAQTAAVFSYIDPVTAIFLSALVLRQPMSVLQICGAVLILGSTMANELAGKKP